MAGRDRAGYGESAHDGDAAQKAADMAGARGILGGGHLRSRYVVFTTDVELDTAAQDTYVPSAKKIVAAYRKSWQVEEKIKREQRDRIWR
jgi:hypothetical protein